MAIRRHGKTAFCVLRDLSGEIQLYFRKDVLGEESYTLFKLLDIGDIVGIEGTVFVTHTGETTIRVEKWTLLSKSLRPLPEKFHGLTDKETRYRQRYLDLIVNPEVKDTFIKRSKIIKGIRKYLDDRHFLEVETPMLHTIAGGAAARPFKTHHNALDMDIYLRIAPELHLKRLLVGGLERVYEMNRCFRNEGIDTRHNPEFTTVELYQAYGDLEDVINITEDMVSKLAEMLYGTMKLTYIDKEIDLTPPWDRMTMIEAVKKFSVLTSKALQTSKQPARWLTNMTSNTASSMASARLSTLSLKNSSKKTSSSRPSSPVIPWKFRRSPNRTAIIRS